MTPREFVIWLKGFVQASNNFNATPKQWDDLKDQLNKVEINDDKLQEVRRFVVDKNSSNSWSATNPYLTNPTVTQGRPEDLITYTTKND